MILHRRSFLAGLGAAMLAAPAIVHAGNLMPINARLIVPKADYQLFKTGYYSREEIRVVCAKIIPLKDGKISEIERYEPIGFSEMETLSLDPVSKFDEMHFFSDLRSDLYASFKEHGA